jgi:hypothetical protein
VGHPFLTGVENTAFAYGISGGDICIVLVDYSILFRLAWEFDLTNVNKIIPVFKDIE